jgi:GR25 family glycosyltransferase involved in LPS biosynthesis/cephalosporin hydroxylase
MIHFHQTIGGWCAVEQFKLYQKMVEEATDGSHFVEIGTWKGKSTSCMGVEIANSGKKIKFDCIDTFKGSVEHQYDPSIVNGTLFDEFKQNTKPIENYINPIVSDSVEAAKNYKDGSIDFIFLDGDHSYEGLCRDLEAWLPKLKPGGVIAGDDINNEDFPDVAKSILNFVTDFDIDNQVWIHRTPRLPHLFSFTTDEHLAVKHNYSREVEKAYIIVVEGNKKSEEQASKCIASCEKISMPYEIFPAYDGTDGKTIKTPEHLKNKDHMRWIKILDHKLNIPEVACALSHIALWAHCMTLQKPIVILEHDAIMMHKFTTFHGYNVIHFLGHLMDLQRYIYCLNEQKEFISDNENIVDYLIRKDIKPGRVVKKALTNLTNINYLYPLGLHAYAIDPMMAKNLFSYVLSEGLINPIDTFVDATRFTLVQEEIYAFQNEEASLMSTLDVNEKDRFFGRKPSFDLPGVSK